jgi:hypothetical protein
MDTLTAELDDCQAEKHALELALAASTAYGRSSTAGRGRRRGHASYLRSTRDSCKRCATCRQHSLRARITEVHTLNARLLIAQGGQV